MFSQLSSDILEKQFGPTRLVVLHQSGNQRLISTVTLSDNRVLEISLVEFDVSTPGLFPEIHQEILAGKSMGKAFRNHKVYFKRETLASAKKPMSQKFQREFGSTEPITICDVSILVGDTKEIYASIIETYNPAVDWPMSDKKVINDVDSRLKTMESLL